MKNITMEVQQLEKIIEENHLLTGISSIKKSVQKIFDFLDSLDQTELDENKEDLSVPVITIVINDLLQNIGNYNVFEYNMILLEGILSSDGTIKSELEKNKSVEAIDDDLNEDVQKEIQYLQSKEDEYSDFIGKINSLILDSSKIYSHEEMVKEFNIDKYSFDEQVTGLKRYLERLANFVDNTTNTITNYADRLEKTYKTIQPVSFYAQYETLSFSVLCLLEYDKIDNKLINSIYSEGYWWEGLLEGYDDLLDDEKNKFKEKIIFSFQQWYKNVTDLYEPRYNVRLTNVYSNFFNVLEAFKPCSEGINDTLYSHLLPIEDEITTHNLTPLKEYLLKMIEYPKGEE